MLLGRCAEREVVERLISGTRGERSGVRGEAGIGKTALLEHARSAASRFPVERAMDVEAEVEAAKLKGGLDIERDQHRLMLVREVLTEAGRGMRPGLMLDANSCWSRTQAVRHVGEPERTLDLTWIEESVRRWAAEGLAAVSRGVHAAVAIGENLNGLEQFRPLIAAGGPDIVQTAAVWGVTHFLRVAALAHAYALPVSPIGNRPVALLHAATSVPNHIASRLQYLQPPIGVEAVDCTWRTAPTSSATHQSLGVRVDGGAITSAYQGNGSAHSGPHVRPEHAGRRLLAITDRGGAVRRPRPHPVDVQPAPANTELPHITRS